MKEMRRGKRGPGNAQNNAAPAVSSTFFPQACLLLVSRRPVSLPVRTWGGEGKDYSVNKRNGNVVYMTQGDTGKVSKIRDGLEEMWTCSGSGGKGKTVMSKRERAMQQKLGILGLSVFCSKVSLDAPPRAQQCHRAGRSQKSYTNTQASHWVPSMDGWMVGFSVFKSI